MLKVNRRYYIRAKKEAGNIWIWNLDQIANKCVRLKETYVIFSLLHAQL